MPSLQQLRAINSDQMDKVKKSNFWQFLGFNQPEQEHKETGHDGPALGSEV